MLNKNQPRKDTLQDIKDHLRINNILLGSLERPLLLWFARHLPAWVTPDKMTALGVAGAIIIFTGYALANRHPGFLWLASLGFFINWFGDSLDGTLARYRNIQRPRYGFFIDHTIDALNETLVFIGLGISPYIHFEIAALALVGYLLLSILVYVRTAVDGVFKISFGGFGPTEVRVIAVLANTIVFFRGNLMVTLPWGVFSIYDLIGLVIAVALFAIFLFSTFMQARELARLKE